MSRLLQKIETFIETEFNEKLPKNRTFHSLNHTKNVVKAVHAICQQTKIETSRQLCLEIAAWFHDYGHVSIYIGHEDMSAEVAEQFLLKQDFPLSSIDYVKRYILSTKIDLEPQSLEEKIIRDADLMHIGLTSYPQHLDNLRKEWADEFNKLFDEKQWLKQNIVFLESHLFHTESATSMYNAQRVKNIEMLKTKLNILQ